MTKSTLQVDADYIVYKNAASCEIDIDYGEDVVVVQSRFSHLQRAISRDLQKLTTDLETQGYEIKETVLFFSDNENFRKQIYPDYKGHRNRKKPAGYRRAVNWLRTEYSVVVYPTLEADDALGVVQTAANNDDIIASPDKDMRQIPGLLFDLKSPVVRITEEEGKRWHLIQTLSGDQTDGYGGCPGIGIKKAETLFEKHGESWETVVAAFEKAGLTEEDALLNARLAKILQFSDYDLGEQKPILWTPS